MYYRNKAWWEFAKAQETVPDFEIIGWVWSDLSDALKITKRLVEKLAGLEE
jgi:hypothetical protein